MPAVGDPIFSMLALFFGIVGIGLFLIAFVIIRRPKKGELPPVDAADGQESSDAQDASENAGAIAQDAGKEPAADAGMGDASTQQPEGIPTADGADAAHPAASDVQDSNAQSTGNEE